VASGRSHCLPDGEGSRTQKSMITRFQQVVVRQYSVRA
jgi:hypothetical protein